MTSATSLLNLALQNRRSSESYTAVILRTLLRLATSNEFVFHYLSSLPPPAYIYANFHDWIPSFLEYYFEEVKKYFYSTKQREDIGNEVQGLFEKYVQ